MSASATACADLGGLTSSGFAGFASGSLGASGAALDAVVSALPFTTRLVILPGRFVGISSFRLVGPKVPTAPTAAPGVDDTVRAGLRSGDCADDGWEDSEATGEVSTFCAPAVVLETPAVG